MFLDIDYRFTATSPSTLIVPDESFKFVQSSICLPYQHLTKDLITDFKRNGKWVKKLGGQGNQKITQGYRTWSAMATRCNGGIGVSASYVGCSMSENFHNFDWFVDWCQIQFGYGNVGWHLDKDILVPGNRQYSESTCCFVPRELNNLLLRRKAARGDLPIGVSVKGGKYLASCSIGTGRTKHLGLYKTPEEAFFAYKVYKERLVKERAGLYRECVAPRVIEALLSYRVDITD